MHITEFKMGSKFVCVCVCVYVSYVFLQKRIKMGHASDDKIWYSLLVI